MDQHHDGAPPPSPSEPPAPAFVRAIDRLSEWTGRLMAWVLLGLVLLVGFDVFMRYAFRQSWVAVQELEWHLFAAIVLLGAAYTLRHDGHVRVDLTDRIGFLGERFRAWRDLIGGIALLLPFCAMVIYMSVPFAYTAYEFGEGSPYPTGLPHRFIIKSAIPLGFALLALQGLAEITRSALVLIRRSKAVS
jgi:TRAP-type mannitol/chloroaromatic compound transport system permease small subunit